MVAGAVAGAAQGMLEPSLKGWAPVVGNLGAGLLLRNPTLQIIGGAYAGYAAAKIFQGGTIASGGWNF